MIRTVKAYHDKGFDTFQVHYKQDISQQQAISFVKSFVQGHTLPKGVTVQESTSRSNDVNTPNANTKKLQAILEKIAIALTKHDMKNIPYLLMQSRDAFLEMGIKNNSTIFYALSQDGAFIAKLLRTGVITKDEISSIASGKVNRDKQKELMQYASQTDIDRAMKKPVMQEGIIKWFQFIVQFIQPLVQHDRALMQSVQEALKLVMQNSIELSKDNKMSKGEVINKGRVNINPSTIRTLHSLSR